MESEGYTLSYDMLGEAARTEADARRYHLAYSESISTLAGAGGGAKLVDRPGVSVKLSALHARYEFGQRDRVMTELVARLRSLALLAQSAGIGLSVDAEEAERLDLSLDVVEAVLAEPVLAGWDGFGVAVQAYGKRAPYVIDWLHELAVQLDRRIMVRLVKGAYWDAEIKRAQVFGLAGFPVFTRKARHGQPPTSRARAGLLGMSERVYPHFATHNAHTMAAVLHMAGDASRFEFQRLHGMGEALHAAVRERHRTRCRIYAPVGAHQDLLAYLVRRLLENGANSSFVNQIVDRSVTPEEIARDPISVVEGFGGTVANPRIAAPAEIFMPHRPNSKGWDLSDPLAMTQLEAEREAFRGTVWEAAPLIAGAAAGAGRAEVRNPARADDLVGHVTRSAPADVEAALEAARSGTAAWAAESVEERASRVRRVADLYEAHAAELFALAAREAGKTWQDAVGEVREACDFARFYANEALRENESGQRSSRGVIACISPWNFPLAIFSGQILAAVAAGNAVVAKPAEQTPLIAARAVSLMHEAGIPREVVQLLPGDGATVGAALTRDPRVDGVCFTGSTATAHHINRAMAGHLAPDAPLIAETGGLNAMIVDSTALPEQAVRDVLASAFQSAGQRCSALRILYIQREVEDRILEMLFGAIDALRVGDPWSLSTDVGPIIDEAARERIESYCRRAQGEGRLLKRHAFPGEGRFVAPTVLRVEGIESLSDEIFGPVLHVATYDADRIDAAVDAVNAAGYGLTFGMHTRIDDRVQHVVDRVRAGNIYINRNQIGAVVGSQPFGGEGESGTGPKAGGPHYLRRLTAGASAFAGVPGGRVVEEARLASAISEAYRAMATWPCGGSAVGPAGEETGRDVPDEVQALPDDSESVDHLRDREVRRCEGGRFSPLDLPGPTGESNRLSFAPRGVVLCLGVGTETARVQAETALDTGNAVVVVADGASRALAPLASVPRVVLLDGRVDPEALATVDGIAAIACSARRDVLAAIRAALARRPGSILPLMTEPAAAERYVLERHVCVDTTAAGGNASLLARAEA